MTERSDYYVYGLWALYAALEPDLIRYVGKGRGRRVIGSKLTRSKRVKDWIEIGEPLFDIIAANLTEVDAYDLEIQTIAKYGREGIDLGGVLLNVSTGGAGAAGYKHTAAALAKLSAVSLGRKRGPPSADHCANLAAANRGRKHTDVARANMAAAQKARADAMTQEERSAIAKAREAAKSLDERKAQTAAAISAAAAANRGRKLLPEHVAKVAAANRGRKRGPPSDETRAAILVGRQAQIAAKRAAMEIAA
jgi:hypothetical protein